MYDGRSPLTVLMVEDDGLVREVVAMYLENAGCHVIASGSGEQAIDAVRRHDSIDVVFTDITLGGRRSGWDVAEAARRIRPGLPVIYTSGSVSGSSGRRVPGSVFLGKPYSPPEVLRTCALLAGAQL